MIPQSSVTRMALRLAPVRRLYEALRRIDVSTDAVRVEQERLGRELARQAGELAALRASAQAPVASAAVARSDDKAPEAPLFVSPGHFYSPIVNPRDLEGRSATIFDRSRPPQGVDLREAEQLRYAERMAAHYNSLPFASAARPGLRSVTRTTSSATATRSCWPAPC